MRAQTKAALQNLKPKVERVDIPELQERLGEDVKLYVCELDALSVFEYIAVFRELAAQPETATIRAKHFETQITAIERALVDEDGEPIFEPGAFASIKLPWTVHQKLLTRVLEISGVAAPTSQAAEPQRKNSPPSGDLRIA